MAIRPKYISFDCYRTLTRFRMGEMTREIGAECIPAAQMEQFVADFSAYRFDEVLGDWQPYDVVLKNAVRRLCRCRDPGHRRSGPRGRSLIRAPPTKLPHAPQDPAA